MQPRRPIHGGLVSRRRALGLGAAAVASISALGRSGVAHATPTRRAVPSMGPHPALGAQTVLDALRPAIRPRADWALDDRPVTGTLTPEDDVRFLLVHHTASTNAYGPDEVTAQIRGFYDFHTGPEKGWPDVAYNFFVDRYGGIWEGRAGSIDGPVRGDATGGSQGFALLCSLIGNFAEEPVPLEQQNALVALLAWLGETYAVDTSPGATVDFVSRGSNKWDAGVTVTAATIAGHRDMSSTSCPGDFGYAMVTDELPTQVSLLRRTVVDAASTTTSTPQASDDATTTTTAPADPTASTTAGAPGANDSAAPAPTSASDSGSGSGQALGTGDSPGGEGGGVESPVLLVVGAVLGVVAAAGGLINRFRPGSGAD